MSDDTIVNAAGKFYENLLAIPMSYYQYAKEGKKFQKDTKMVLYSLAMIICRINLALGQNLEADNPDHFSMVKSFIWDWDSKDKLKEDKCELIEGAARMFGWVKDLVSHQHQGVVKGGKITPECTEAISRVCRVVKLLSEDIPLNLDHKVEKDNQFGSAMEYFLPLNKK